LEGQELFFQKALLNKGKVWWPGFGPRNLFERQTKGKASPGWVLGRIKELFWGKKEEVWIGLGNFEDQGLINFHWLIQKGILIGNWPFQKGWENWHLPGLGLELQGLNKRPIWVRISLFGTFDLKFPKI